MRFFRSPVAVQYLFKNFEWRKESTGKVIYLTFDDGPIPEVTDFVLHHLNQVGAKATFFCVGENLERHKPIARRLLNAGHSIGNHTHNHLKGWETTAAAYLENIARCETAITAIWPARPAQKLFRPPYGKISRVQVQAIKQEYRIIMWDVLTYDFDATFPAENCLKISIELTRPGSIVVFHDSQKARRNLEFTLPRFLQHFKEKGYRFETL